MSDKLTELEEKVGLVIDRLETLKTDNTSLRQENIELKGKLTQLMQDFDRFRLQNNDQSELVKSRLAAVLGRIEELEKIGL